tara:strand:- start:4415 stop:5470 length:1056 start_codon:yes stop_codon:yes gene_type:complete
MSAATPTRKNTFIYARVSGNQTRINNNDPTSPFISSEYQISRCISYSINNLNVNGASVIKEDKPSFSTEMSQQVDLFELLKDNNIHIIFLRVDRFSRCFSKALEIINSIIPSKNITLYFVEENIVYNKNSTQGVKQLLTEALMKAYVESDNLSRRQKDINSHLKSQGHELGPAPYGKKIAFINGIRTKIIDDHESKIIDFIKKSFSPKKFNNNTPISFRVLNNMMMNLTDDNAIKKKIKDDPIQIWNTKVTSEMNQLDAGFDAEDIAFILNDKGIKKRNKEWTTNSISNIVNNLKRKRNDIEQTVTVDNDTYIEGLKRRRTKNKKIFNGKTGQAHDLLQNQVTNDFGTSTI